MFSIIVSEKDLAGLTMKNIFVENFSFKQTQEKYDNNYVYAFKDFELLTIKEFQVFADYLNERETDFFIFASRHSSKVGTPSLTVHPIGNWGNAGLGGKSNELVPTSAILMKNYLLSLQEKKELRHLPYEVSYETSHHGPFLSKPTVFIELGSSEKQWTDETAATTICETIIENTSLKPKTDIEQKVCLSFGGTHYVQEFSKLALRKDYAFSHMCPKYALADFNEMLLKKAIACTKEIVQEFVLDSKSMGSEKNRIISTLKKSPIPYSDVRKLLK